MNRSTFFAAVLALAGVAVLSGCGSSGRPDAPSGEISSAMASSFAGNQGSNIVNSSNGYAPDGIQGSFINSGTRRDMRSLSRMMKLDSREADVGGCSPTVDPATTTDADNDDFPVTETFTYSCTEGTDGIGLSGNFKIEDLDDATAFPAAGFLFSVNSFSVTLGSTISFVLSGSARFTPAAGTPPPSAALATEMTMTLSAGDQTGEIGYFVDSTVTPTDPASPEDAGDISITGFFRLAAGEAGEYVLGISTTDLTYDSTACARHNQGKIKSGKLTFVDGVPNTLEATFTDCEPAWTFNGTGITTRN